MKPKYDMICTKEFGFSHYEFKIKDKCRILDFKRNDYFRGGIIVAVEFERNINGHNANMFTEANGKMEHCVYFDTGDMEHLKFI